MRRIELKFLCFIILLAQYNCSIAQWELLVHDPDYAILNTIKFFNINKGITGSLTGNLYITDNAGTSWTKVFSKPGEAFWDITYVSESIVFAASYTGGLYRSNDGGYSWHATNTNFTSVTCIQFFGQVGFLADKHKIYKTSDSGSTWQELNIPADFTTQTIWKMCFPDQLTGFAGSTSGNMIKTIDGGISWQEIGFPGSGLGTLFFLNKDTGYATDMYYVYKTTSGGIGWEMRLDTTNEEHEILQFYNWQDIHFLDTDNGYFVGGLGPMIFKTSDGGITLTQIETIDEYNGLNSINSIDCINDKCYVAGHEIIAGKNTYTTINDRNLSIGYSVYPNPNRGEMNIRIPGNISDKKCYFELYNSQGNKIIHQPLYSADTFLKTSLPSGIYYYYISNHDGLLFKDKIVMILN